MRTVAIFRYINPEAHIRLAAGRALMKDVGCFEKMRKKRSIENKDDK